MSAASWATTRSRDPHVDDIAVEEACAGRRVRLTCAERTAVVATLTRRGLSAKAIAAMFGISARTVVRHRAAA